MKRRELLWLFVALATAQSVPATEAPKLVLDPESWDFGRTLRSRVLEKQFTLKNVGTADLVIDRITTSCGCTAALLDESTIKPGKSAVLKVSFETRSSLGRVRHNVLLRSNDRARDPLEIKLQATVEPQ